MMRARWGAYCAIAVMGLLAVACVPPTTPTNNLPPVAQAAASPSEGPAPLQVTFDPTGSIDPDGTIVSYAWDLGDGTTSTESNPSHTYSSAGVYTAELTVTDDDGATDTATATVTVTASVNAVPVAVVTADVTQGPAPLEVTFDGSGSADTDGTIVSYEWDLGDGVTSTDVAPSRTFTAPGPHTVVLTVTDDDGATASASIVVTVTAAQPPVAVVTADRSTGTAPLLVSFDGSDSTDSDGTLVSYEWDFGDGSPVATGAQVSREYAAPGTFSATLTVTDSGGLTDTAQVAIEVVANQAPVAVASADPSSGAAPLTVDFDGTGSLDADGTIVSYAWDFGDGSPVATGAQVSHEYLTAGPFTATLTVTDDLGATDSATVAITVDEGANTLPVADAAADPTSGIAPLTVDFDGTGSLDADGTLVSYDWDFGDGTTGAGAEVTHVFTSAGQYPVVLTVTDDRGGSSTAALTIDVAANVAPSAAASATPTQGIAPLDVQFSSAGSVDTDGSIVTYLWDFGDGTSTSTSADPSHVYAAAGSYTATLTVTDDLGAQDSAQVVVSVVANVAPTAVANADVQSGARPLSVEFDASASVDPDGTISSYEWDFGDGSTSTDANPTHVFAEGEWSVTLTVTDDRGATDTSDAIVITAVVDDDGDGYSPPLDCDDDAAATNPGAADELDASGADTNCDGYDGVLSDQILVATTGADTSTCGSPAEPCATIPYGQFRATSADRGIVGLAAGEYAAFQMANGLTIAGGYDADFQRGDAASGDTTAVVNGETNPAIGGTVAILINGLTQPSKLLELEVRGLDAAPGQNSYGIIARDSGEVLTLESVHVIAGDGGAGAAGTAGTGATQSPAASGGTGANAERSAQTCNTTRQSGGGAGTTSTPGANGGAGGAGGQKDTSCSFGVCTGGNCNSTAGLGGANAAAVVGSSGLGGGGGARCDCGGDAPSGGAGQPGRTQHGSGGQPTWAPVGDTDGNGLWVADNGLGGNGSLGLDGTGGGGGGGGGGNDNGTDARGAGGGGGGAGGARATLAGTGGRPGGASIGILVTSTQPTVVDVSIELGTGGAGGAGGAGALGQPGGAGGSGGSPESGGRGGAGGNGGTGGHAGGGAGGSGGPAIGLAVGGSGSVLSGTTTATGGVGGAAGAGGAGAVPGFAGIDGLRIEVASL